MGLPQYEEYYRYQDYLEWPEDMRYELIDGVPYSMAPGPTERHQKIVGEFFGEFRAYLKGKPCEARVSPLDIRLNADGADDTVVQPDVMIICDKAKFDGASIMGAPDLVVEVLSPSTKNRDLRMKYALYEEYGVREYWIADPEAKTVAVHVNVNGKFQRLGIFSDIAKSWVFPGLIVELTEIFA